jgi:hypothetical protein
MLAQLAVETNNRVLYQGFDQYVEMAGYLPRNLLVILKNIVDWADGIGDNPLAAERPLPFSERAISIGVRQAADWFALDAKPIGLIGNRCEVAIARLGSLLRSLRFSDRPTETTCSGFTASSAGQDGETIEVLDTCVAHNLLIRLPDPRRDRNSAEALNKYQLHPLLAPRYDLPTARRGFLALKPLELRAVFSPSATGEDYAGVVSRRTADMIAPFRSLRASGRRPDTEPLFP